MDDNFTDISDVVKQDEFSPFFSYGHPEQEKVRAKPESKSEQPVEIEEVVEHEPDKEMNEYVQPRKESVEVDEDLKKTGVKAEKTTSFPTYQKIQLPISDEKVMKGLRQPISSSVRWLAEFCIFLLKQAHLSLKNTHGKIIRVIKR